MSVLHALRPFLRAASQVTFTVSEEAGKLVILSTSKLKKVDEDTDDPELAALQSALATPRRFVVPEGVDPDAEVIRALTTMAVPYTAVAEQLDDYNHRLTELANQAKAAKQEKAEKGASKSTKTSPSKPAAKAAPKAAPAAPSGDASDDDDVDDSSSASEPASADVAPAASLPSSTPIVGTTADVFEGL